MRHVIALLGLLIVLLISLLAVRVGAIILELTGVSKEIAIFQAESAFTGAGFTSSETEIILNSHVRRKVIRTLMLLGNLGFTTAAATLVIAFIGDSGHTETQISKFVVLLCTIIFILYLSKSKYFTKLIKKVIIKTFESQLSPHALMDYQELLGLELGFTISKIRVKDNTWLEGKNLRELRLADEGIMVLSISKTTGSNTTTIFPQPDEPIRTGDTLTLYGKRRDCQDLVERNKTIGSIKHEQKCDEFNKIKEL